MEKQIICKDGENIVIINIEAKKHFSITGTELKPKQSYLDFHGIDEDYFYDVEYVEHIDGKEYIFISGGVIHDTILRLRPDLKNLVDLHLSDMEGKPMHAYANGKYHLLQTGIQSAAKYLRTSESKLQPLLEAEGLGFDDIYLSLLPQWKKEAKEGLKFIKQLR